MRWKRAVLLLAGLCCTSAWAGREEAEKLLEIIRSGTRQERSKALFAARGLAPADCVYVYSEAISSDSSFVRSHATQGLIYFPDLGGPAIPALIQAMHDENVGVATSAIGTLRTIKAPATEIAPFLRGNLQRSSVGHSARQLLGFLGEPLEAGPSPLDAWHKRTGNDSRLAAFRQTDWHLRGLATEAMGRR